MSHTVVQKKKLLDRVRRIRGQIDAVERGLEEEQDPYAILQTVAACHGALNGLMREIIAGHIQFHLVDKHGDDAEARAEAGRQLMEVIRSYLR